MALAAVQALDLLPALVRAGSSMPAAAGRPVFVGQSHAAVVGLVAAARLRAALGGEASDGAWWASGSCQALFGWEFAPGQR